MISEKDSKLISSIDEDIEVVHDTDDPDVYCFMFVSGDHKGVAFNLTDLNLGDNEHVVFDVEFLNTNGNITNDLQERISVFLGKILDLAVASSEE